MKILLVGNYIPDQQESMLLFGELLNKNLKNKDITIEIWKPKQLLGDTPNTTTSKYLAYVDKFIFGSLDLFLKRVFKRYDLYHILDHSNVIYSNVLPKNKTIVTCHDCIAIEEALYGRTGEKIGKFGKYLQKLIMHDLKKVTLIVSVSNQTKKDLIRLIGIEENKIELIYNSPYTNIKKYSESEVNSIMKKENLPIDEDFIFSLGNNLIRKNRKGIVKGYIQHRNQKRDSLLKLWIAGKPYNEEIEQIIENSPYSRDIRYIGRVDDELLNALYIKCEIFAFPSIDEGFGVPIIEAQLCNALVITSDKEPMSEVAGKAAILVDPYSIDSIADGFNNYQQFQENIKFENQNNVQKFSKENLITSYLNLYRKVTHG